MASTITMNMEMIDGLRSICDRYGFKRPAEALDFVIDAKFKELGLIRLSDPQEGQTDIPMNLFDHEPRFSTARSIGTLFGDVCARPREEQLNFTNIDEVG